MMNWFLVGLNFTSKEKVLLGIEIPLLALGAQLTGFVDFSMKGLTPALGSKESSTYQRRISPLWTTTASGPAPYPTVRVTSGLMMICASVGVSSHVPR